MRDRLIKFLATIVGVCGLILLAVPLTIYDAYCRLEEWFEERNEQKS
jgi:hypothetical protein